MSIRCATITLLFAAAACTPPVKPAPPPAPPKPSILAANTFGGSAPAFGASAPSDVADPFSAIDPPALPAVERPPAFDLKLTPVARPVVSEQSLPFPPTVPEAPRVRSTAPQLQILRVSPTEATGDIGQVLVRFNQPMVPIAELELLGSKPAPLKLDPEPPGKYRWIDTATVVFEPARRLPLGTRFTAKVRGTTSSVLGKILGKDYTWTFESARPMVVDAEPGTLGEIKSTGVVKLLFDVAVKPEAVAAFAHWRRAEEEIPVDVVEAGEIREGWQRDRTVVLEPKTLLSPGAVFEISLDAGWVGSEGPLPATARFAEQITSAGDMAFTALRCDEPCAVGTPVALEFTNSPIDQPFSKFVSVAPAVPGLRFEPRWKHVAVTGRFVSGVRYTFHVAAGVIDDDGRKTPKAGAATITFARKEQQFEINGAARLGLVSARKPELEVSSTNVDRLEVKLWAIAPERAAAALAAATDPNLPVDPAIFTKTAARSLVVAVHRDEAVLTKLDLRPFFDAAGHGLVLAEVRAPGLKSDAEWGRAPQRVLLQSTGLGLAVSTDGSALHALVTNASDAGAVANALVELRDAAGALLSGGRTDTKGVASVTLPTAIAKGSSLAIVARTDSDAVSLVLDDPSALRRSSAADGVTPRHTLEGTAWPDRGIYRPGETVHLTAFLRQRVAGPQGDLARFSGTVTWDLFGPRGALTTGTVQQGDDGTTVVASEVAKDADVGEYTIRLKSKGLEGTVDAAFQVAEFRTPEFDVKTKLGAEGGEVAAGTRVGAITEARYLFGTPMAGATYEWNVATTPSVFAPSAWPGFSFGRQRGWWDDARRGRFANDGQRPAPQRGSGVLDAAGRVIARVETSGQGTNSPTRFQIEATVTDTNRQAVSSSTGFVAHPAKLYAGIAQADRFVPEGAKLSPRIVVVDWEGKVVKGAEVKVAAYRTDGDKETEIANLLVSSESEPVAIELRASAEPGRHELRATVKDADGRIQTTVVPVWVDGAFFAGRSEPELVVLPQRSSYASGDTANVLIKAPWRDGSGFLTVNREGFAQVLPFEISDGSAMVRLRVRDEWLPGVALRAVALGPEEKETGRAVGAEGLSTLEIDNAHRRLFVEIAAQAPVTTPGAETSITVKTLDSSGAARKARVVVAVVDEGVLSLTGFKTPEPIAAYRTLPGDANTQRADGGWLEPWLAAGAGSEAPGAVVAGRGRNMIKLDALNVEGREPAPRFDLRSRFLPTAFYTATLDTDETGHVTTRFKLPDDLTTWRVMAIATDGAKLFGSGEAKIVTRRAVIVRPALPRFLNVGDHFDAAATIHNETGADADLEVRLVAANAKIEGGRTRIALKKGESREVRFPAVALAPGPAVFQFAAVALTRAHPTDAAEVTVPVQIPASVESFATYGVTYDVARIPVILPLAGMPGFGGVDVQLSSSALAGVPDAAMSVLSYPYECAEQTASRLIALASLKELGKFGGAGLPSDTERTAQAAAAVDRLRHLAREDGSFGLWEGSRGPSFFLTAYVARAIDVGIQSGLTPAATDVRDGALRWLAAIAEQPRSAEDWDRSDAAEALAALELSKAGNVPKVVLDRLITGAAALPTFAVAWLWEAAWRAKWPKNQVDSLQGRLLNAAVESAGAIHFAERRSEALRVLMHTDDRTDAIVLAAFLTIAPKDSMVEKIARGVLRTRKAGVWSTTQANAWAVSALAAYADVFEAEVPKFDVRAWFGDRMIAARRFEGREPVISRLRVPFDALEGPAAELTLAKEGEGRLYYRVGMQYAPKALTLPAEDRGFAVQRTFEPIEGITDVRKGPDGVWHVKAGSTIRMRVSLVAPDRAHYVALVSPLAGGLELVDPRLATTAQLGPAELPGRTQWWWRGPWDHEDLRDDRAQAFADDLWAGVYEHATIVRATTPGTFVMAPARAEEMYAPETFGRSATDTITIE